MSVPVVCGWLFAWLALPTLAAVCRPKSRREVISGASACTFNNFYSSLVELSIGLPLNIAWQGLDGRALKHGMSELQLPLHVGLNRHPNPGFSKHTSEDDFTGGDAVVVVYHKKILGFSSQILPYLVYSLQPLNFQSETRKMP